MFPFRVEETVLCLTRTVVDLQIGSTLAACSKFLSGGLGW